MSDLPPPSIVYQDPREVSAALRRKKARIRLAALAVGILVIAGVVWYLKVFRGISLDKVASLESTIEKAAVNKVAENFAAPPPLKAPPKGSAGGASSSDDPTLTKAGIISQTNKQRSLNGGLKALSENTTLDAIATARLDDMFKKQYFAHVAPDGGSAQTVAKTEGYDYVAIGENLALGTFAGDKGVVDAWMASPGHRANILNTHYTEIGVAARADLYEGVPEWIAVQIFGRPAADCPLPNPDLKATVDAAQNSITAMNAELAQEKAAIDAMQPQSGSAYNAKVDAYNELVRQYNALVAQTKVQIGQYNGQVSTYNACISQ